jgi:hypothetical protein
MRPGRAACAGTSALAGARTRRPCALGAGLASARLAARAPRDRGVRATFFEVPPTKGSRELADQRTPEVARHWSYRMNMGLDSFEAPLAKFGHVDE